MKIRKFEFQGYRLVLSDNNNLATLWNSSSWMTDRQTDREAERQAVL